MDFSRCQPPCSRLIASDDQHGKCVRCVGLAHARDVIFDISNCKYCENFTSKTLCARLTVFDQESAVLSCRFRRPPSYAKLRPGVRMRSSRLWRVNSFHFLSLHHLGVTAQIIRSSFLAAVLHPAQRHGTPIPSGWKIFYILRPQTRLRSSSSCHDVCAN